MAQTNHILLTLLLLLSVSQDNIIPKKGFSMRLVHSDSVRNPSLFANLTTFQRILRHLETVEPHIHCLKSRMKITEYNPTSLISAILSPKESIFMASVNIGTQAGQHAYHLQLDTGSNLTWIQCVPCNPCFPQNKPKFDPNLSPTYAYYLANATFCSHPYWNDKGRCAYTIEYMDKTRVNGVLSSESFTFVTTNDPPHVTFIPNITFGCIHSSQIDFDGEPVGVMGMDYSRDSLAMQLAFFTQGRFSYCFFHPEAADVGYLKFGNDIVMKEPVFRTPFVDFPGRNEFFNLNLEDISIQDHRLGIDQDTFKHTFIDSGADISLLIRPAYDQVRDEIASYFKPFGLIGIDGPSHNLLFDLCYVLPHEFVKNLPRMKWHLRGADLLIDGPEVFLLDEDRQLFCLAMLPDDEMFVLGLHQLYNTRFTFDLLNEVLLFSAENCSQDLQ